MRVLIAEYKAIEAEFEEEKKLHEQQTDDFEMQSRTKSATTGYGTSVRTHGSKIDEPAPAGKFVRVEGENFDIIINILIGIRRSLSNLYQLPGQ